MSFVTSLPNGFPCEHFTDPPPMCLALSVATGRDVAMVGASGNDKTLIHFPARDPRVIAAGGYQVDGTLWDEAPSGNEADCPLDQYGLDERECGSNYSIFPSGPRQELATSAKSVLSTTYPQYNWSPAIRCGDQFQFSGTSWGGGTGLCTGTSMSAPQVAGLLGLIRSVNPLVPFGDAPTTPGTLRHVLASTTSRAQAGLGWEAELGYGIPDAEAAARKMLGKVARAPVRNRATPLFRLRSAAANGGVGDYADTTSPQSALAMMLNAKNAWVPSGPTTAAVPGYPQFPHGPDEGPAADAAPRAPVYVLSTEVRPRNEWPALVPLYLMSRRVETGHIDFMLVTTEADIEAAHNQAGYTYQLHTIQGYVHAPCTPEPSCIPPGATHFYRGCTASGDCAAFLGTEAGSFSSYTRGFPWSANGTRLLLGYAWPAGDGENNGAGDGLPDAFEYVVGTDPTHADSDRDGIVDKNEMPLVGVPTGDPCHGGTGSLHCGADVIFRYGFE